MWLLNNVDEMSLKTLDIMTCPPPTAAPPNHSLVIKIIDKEVLEPDDKNTFLGVAMPQKHEHTL